MKPWGRRAAGSAFGDDQRSNVAIVTSTALWAYLYCLVYCNNAPVLWRLGGLAFVTEDELAVGKNSMKA